MYSQVLWFKEFVQNLKIGKRCRKLEHGYNQWRFWEVGKKSNNNNKKERKHFPLFIWYFHSSFTPLKCWWNKKCKYKETWKYSPHCNRHRTITTCIFQYTYDKYLSEMAYYLSKQDIPHLFVAVLKFSLVSFSIEKKIAAIRKNWKISNLSLYLKIESLCTTYHIIGSKHRRDYRSSITKVWVVCVDIGEFDLH